MKKTKVPLRIKKVNGKRVSPVLPPSVRNYIIDIDGTICEDIPNEEPDRMVAAAVFHEAKNMLNKWYNEGHIITLFTSRTEQHRTVTEKWLKRNGFKYHTLLVGKPRGGNYYWLDNAPIKVMKVKKSWKN
jgi:hypothetical protein